MNGTTELIPYDVYIEDDQVCFSVGNQHFALGFEVDYELDYPVTDQLNWMKDQLEHALAALAGQGWQAEKDWEAVAADQAMTIAMMKQREWVRLTDEEIAVISAECAPVTPSDLYFARAIEAKIKEKNAYGWQSVANPTEYLDDLRGGADE